MRATETAGGSSDPYYDLFGDWDLIVSSFLTQYGLRIRTKEFETVSWDEFRSLLAGIAPETPLGRVVAIRSETDKNVIRHFQRIRNGSMMNGGLDRRRLSPRRRLSGRWNSWSE